MMRRLILMAVFDGPLPVDEARAEAAYWRDAVEYAAALLAPGHGIARDWAAAAQQAENYLRKKLAAEETAPDGSRVLVAEEPCYDCRTTEQRIAAIEQRLDRDSDALAGQLARLLQRVEELKRQLDTVEHQLEEDAERLGVHARRMDRQSGRLDALEHAVAALHGMDAKPAPVGYQHAAIKHVLCPHCYGTGRVSEMPREDDDDGASVNP